jgi:nickel-type superoxide dismutase maturation protease
LIRSWSGRVEVAGDSMAPTLRPGDWLLADPEAYARRPPSVGQLVLVPDPRESSRLLVKRVAAVGPDGYLDVRGEDELASTDSRTFGPVDPSGVAGRPWFRYWPAGRVGRVR